jgi:hypothetical protein
MNHTGADLCSSPLRHLPSSSRESPEHGLSITVVFTTVAATLMALEQGGQLAQQLGARTRILVPHVVPYPLPIDRPPVDPEFRLRRFRTLSVEGAIETQIEVRLCRDSDQTVMQGLPPRSVVLIGGRKRWRPTRERRLAKRLALAGHHVIFVPQS